MKNCFVAIDFETANVYRDSACAIGIVRVENNEIVAKECRLINPNTYFLRDFTENVHGITADDVEDAPDFAAVWHELSPMLDGADFFAAHNCQFDRDVLYTCCKKFKMEPPTQKFVCSLKLARQHWNLDPAALPDVCKHLGIDLNHHEAPSDASACAQILIMAANEGYNLANL